MQLLDQHLRELVMQKVINADEAARFAMDPTSVVHAQAAATPKPVTADAR
jgi:hypothetical protein